MRPPDCDALEDGLRFAPPPVVHESVPGCRAGHVWVSGYWDWKNGHHVWIGGHWVPARQGCHWQRHRWVPRDGRWYLESGGWVVDQDHGAHQAEACEERR